MYVCVTNEDWRREIFRSLATIYVSTLYIIITYDIWIPMIDLNGEYGPLFSYEDFPTINHLKEKKLSLLTNQIIDSKSSDRPK